MIIVTPRSTCRKGSGRLYDY